MPPPRRLVMGERVDDLLPPLLAMRDSVVFADDGMASMSCTLPWPVIAPLARALMRAEARLLREDANRLVDEPQEPRTAEQRQFDALMLLIKLVAASARARSRRISR